MTVMERAIKAKELGVPFWEAADKLKPEDFRIVFLASLTGIIHKLSDDYWNKIVSKPPSGTAGPELKDAAQEFLNALDKYRASLNEHAHALNNLRERINKPTQWN